LIFFEYLDVLTTSPYTDARSRASTEKEIQRIAARLKELTPLRASALNIALKAGRVEYAYLVEANGKAQDSPPASPMCHEAQEYWQKAQPRLGG
jgi:hypothetical protein